MDITRHLGTQEIARLRIGIGRPPGRQDPADYVLGRFGKSEREEIDIAIENAADSVELWLTEGAVATMNKYNQGPSKPKKEKHPADADQGPADTENGSSQPTPTE